MPRNKLTTLVVAIAALLLGFALNKYGSAFFAEEATPPPASSGDAQRRVHLENAAEEVIAAAHEGVATARSEDQAMQRIEVSIETLRLLGLLGDDKADSRAEQLLDELQKKVDGTVVDAIIQIRMARKLRQFPRLNDEERTAAIDRFISDVKEAGAEPAHGEFVMRISEILTENPNTEDLALRVVSQLAPEFRKAHEPDVQRMAVVLEGIERRLTLLGKPLELEGTMLDGSKFNWDDYRGKVVLVDFWNSGCVNCRAEAPNVLANYEAYKDKGFEVVSVNLDEDPVLAKLYMEQTGFTFPTLFSFDPQATGWNHPMGRRYGVTKLPVVFLVDQNGIVVNTNAQGEILGMHLAELLGEPNGGARQPRALRGEGNSNSEPTTRTGAGLRRVVPASAVEETRQPPAAAGQQSASESP
jgi:thiol-disulfide isomerase/thioredoxin